MYYKLKYLASIAIIALIVFGCNSDKSEKDQDKQKINQTDPVKKEPKDQYRTDETFLDDKNQLMDLIEGPATFKIVYNGDSHFRATIRNGEDSVIVVLADVNGNYKGTKTINVPKTSAYILDVRCKGSWSVYRE